MAEQTLQRRAALTAIRNRRTDNMIDGKIDVRAGSDKRRVVAARRQNGTSQPFADQSLNLARHGGCARCANQRNLRVFRQLHQFGVITNQNLRQIFGAIRRTARLCPPQQRNYRKRRQRRFARRTPNHGIAACQGDQSVQRPNPQRKIERCNDRDGTQRQP